jgi:hypothetical protein
MGLVMLSNCAYLANIVPFTLAYCTVDCILVLDPIINNCNSDSTKIIFFNVVFVRSNQTVNATVRDNDADVIG